MIFDIVGVGALLLGSAAPDQSSQSITSAPMLQPAACAAPAGKPKPACRPQKDSPRPRAGLPSRAERERIFEDSGILPEIDRRALDEADRDLLFMAARAGDFERLAAKYAWLSSSQAAALVAATRPQEEPSICNGPADSVRLFWIGELEVRPGQAVELRPSWSQRPGSFDEIPEECVTNLALSKDAPAVILPGQRRLTVSSDAPHGAQFEVRADIAGEIVTGNLRVVVPAAAPLVGTWKQQSIACDSDSTPRPDVIPSSHKTRVQELVIRANNTFSVTWLQPFESYYDYWGEYRWDAEQGTVEFIVEGGNRPPRAFDGSGKVRRNGDELVFNDVDFGEPDSHYPTAGCEIVFRR